MTDKQIKEDICPYQGECSINGCKRNNDDCFIKQLFEERYMAEKQIIKLNKTIKTKEQENEELRQYHNKCCEENAKKMEEWLKKYNQISRDFHNGKYCNEENCILLKAKEQELKNICKAFDIEYAIDEETGNLIGRCNKLYKKEQEYEELKKNVEHWKMEHKEAKAKGEWTYDLVKKRLGQQLDQLKAEKEEIKKYLGISSKTIIERLEELQEFRDNDKYKLYQAEQTLTEIKEIAEKAAKCLYATESDDYTDGYRWLGSIILQKIRKCEVENERILSEE